MDKELTCLLGKLAHIQDQVGGNVSESTSVSKAQGQGDEFLDLKCSFAERLHQVKQTVSNLYSSPTSPTSKSLHPREKIQQQQQIRETLRELDADWKTMSHWLEKQNLKKKSKFSEDERLLRHEILEQYAQELMSIKEQTSAGYLRATKSKAKARHSLYRQPSTPTSASSSPRRSPRKSMAHFRNNHGMNDISPPEVVSSNQRQMLDQIEKTDETFEVMIHEIGQGVQELSHIAKGMNEEITKQNMMLDDLEGQVDTAGDHVKNVNVKMKETLGKMGRGADKCMMDFICLILLLGVLTVLYNMLLKAPSTPEK